MRRNGAGDDRAGFCWHHGPGHHEIGLAATAVETDHPLASIEHRSVRAIRAAISLVRLTACGLSIFSYGLGTPLLGAYRMSCARSMPRSITSANLRLHRVSRWERSPRLVVPFAVAVELTRLVDALGLFEANRATVRYLGRA